MADTQEFPYEYNKSGKIKFIFSANGKMKDSLESMLRGISSLSKEKVKQIEFHLTGVKESTVREILGDNFDSMQDVIILHSWMEYKDLVELYNQAHFLFLAREKNHMTESNFPSKVPEAMTYGVIPIVSDVGDYTKYYLEDGKNALIMNGYDVEVCMKSLNRAIVLPKEEIKSLSNRCREFAEDVFDYRNWTDIINFGLEVLSED